MPRRRTALLALALLTATHAPASAQAPEAGPDPGEAHAGGDPGASVAPGESAPEADAGRPDDDPSERAPEERGTIHYAGIDAATVRVFAVAGVRPFYARGRRSRRTLAMPEVGHGSGVLVDPRGIVLTAKHVVEGARHIAVRLPGGAGVRPATVVGTHDRLDVAILVVQTEAPLPFVPIPDEVPELRVRQTVDAIGYPLDPTRERPQSSRGIVSGELEDGHLQLAIAVNPGNSGGPLVDEQEELIGIVIARGDPNAGVQGIGVAVPLRPLVRTFRWALDGPAERGWARLEENRASQGRRARTVDALVRLGGVEMLLEAARIGANQAEPERLEELARFAESDDPDLLALLSGYFWNAAILMLEGAGGASTPSGVLDLDKRALIQEVWDRAKRLAARALAIDVAIGQRAPFVLTLARSEPGVQAEDDELPPGVEAPAPTPTGPYGWFPLLEVGFDTLVTSGGWAHGASGALTFPVLLSGTQADEIRVGMALGAGFLWARYSDAMADRLDLNGEETAWSAHALLGVVGRFGFQKFAWIISLAWTPGYTRAWDCDGRDCEREARVTPEAARFTIALAVRNIQLGFSGRVTGPDFHFGLGGFLGTTF